MPTLSDAEWQARDDAYTLAHAEEIKKDRNRLSKAKAAAKKLAEEKQKEADSIKKVSGSSNSQTITNNTGSFGRPVR